MTWILLYLILSKMLLMFLKLSVIYMSNSQYIHKENERKNFTQESFLFAVKTLQYVFHLVHYFFLLFSRQVQKMQNVQSDTFFIIN